MDKKIPIAAVAEDYFNELSFEPLLPLVFRYGSYGLNFLLGPVGAFRSNLVAVVRPSREIIISVAEARLIKNPGNYPKVRFNLFAFGVSNYRLYLHL